jgi:hypothetical protein
VDQLPPGAKLWLQGLLRERTFWQVVTMVVLLLILVALGPRLGVHLTYAALP